MATTKLMTAEEFMALPDDGWRYELIRGVPHRMSPAGMEHGEVGSEIHFALKGHVDPRGLGRVYGADTGFLFERDPDIVRAPDVAFVRAERVPPREQRRGFSPVVPDLAVEVVSPSDVAEEVAEKVAFYLDHGVPLVWVAYPTPQQVAVHRPGRSPLLLGVGDVLDGGDVLPGLRLPVADIFR
jgi:Uma2 family endonuclease